MTPPKPPAPAAPITEIEAVEAALVAFPKLYYFVPRMPAFAVIIPKEKRAGLAKQLGKDKKPSDVTSIKIQEPLDTILWLIDTLCPERENTHCLQSDLKHVVTRWTKLSFGRELAKLYAAELISGQPQVTAPGESIPDRRRRELRLTLKGRRVLERVKNDRRKILKLLFKDLTPTQMQNVANGLGEVAVATWPKMKARTADKRKRRSRKKRRQGKQ